MFLRNLECLHEQQSLYSDIELQNWLLAFISVNNKNSAGIFILPLTQIDKYIDTKAADVNPVPIQELVAKKIPNRNLQ